MSRGFRGSIFLHLVILLLFFLGVNFPKKHNGIPRITNVEIVKIDRKTNLKADVKQDDKVTKSNLKPDMKRDDKVIKSKSKTQAKSQKTPSAKKQFVKSRKPIKKTTKQKAALKSKQSKKQQISEVDVFLKNIDKRPLPKRVNKPAEKKQKPAATGASSYDPSKALTISQIEYLRNKITSNFDSPVLYHFVPGEVVIELKLNLHIDGSVNNVELLHSSTYSKRHQQIFLSLANNLIRACYKAAPLDELPKDLYSGPSGWHEIIISFDASKLM